MRHETEMGPRCHGHEHGRGGTWRRGFNTEVGDEQLCTVSESTGKPKIRRETEKWRKEVKGVRSFPRIDGQRATRRQR